MRAGVVGRSLRFLGRAGPGGWACLAYLLAPAALPDRAHAEGKALGNFNETVEFIDEKLKTVERNKLVDYRFTPADICTAYWGNDQIRIAIPFGEIERIGINTGTDASVLCADKRWMRGRPRPPGCILMQHNGPSGWATGDTSFFARFASGSLAASAQVQQSLAHLMRMCGGGQ